MYDLQKLKPSAKAQLQGVITLVG